MTGPTETALDPRDRDAAADGPRLVPSLAELTRVALRIGLLSFGGPAAQIALMHREIVEERGWLTESEYLRALGFCMLLPGPEAMQLATYAGWRLHGVRGALVTGGLFVLPGATVVLALAFAYHAAIDRPLTQALFLGVKAAVLALVVEAILRVARRALTSRARWAVAILAFLALAVFAVPFPAVLAVAALWGAVSMAPAAAPAAPPPQAPGAARRALATVAAGLALWWAPVAAVALAGQGLLVDVGLFFSRLSVVTFGGAYAVLAYMAQEVVDAHGWVTPAELMDALGLAETTPGPLILVTAFVAVLAGLGQGGAGLGLAAGLLALWVTFVPSFLFVLAGAPLIDRLAGRPRLAGALAGITAAVVGVIANLSLWFALHLLFADLREVRAGPVRTLLPEPASLQPLPAALALVAAWLLLRRHAGVGATLAVTALLAALLAAAG